MDQIAKGFQRDGSKRITFNAGSIGAQTTPASRSCISTPGGKDRSRADYVVVSMPLNMSRPRHQPVMRYEAVGVTYSNSAKIGLAMKRRWERTTAFSAGTCIEPAARQILMPVNNYFTKGVLLGL
jgi:monoamine oxidase